MVITQVPSRSVGLLILEKPSWTITIGLLRQMVSTPANFPKNCSTHQITHNIIITFGCQQQWWRLYLRVLKLSTSKIKGQLYRKINRILVYVYFLHMIHSWYVVFCRLQVSRTKLVRFKIITTAEFIVLNFKGIDVMEENAIPNELCNQK